MPGKARVDTPGALHHIIIRGGERKPIFKDKIDYGNFIDRLSKILVDTGTTCFAWALSLTPSAVSKSVVKGREAELAGTIENDVMTLLERQT
ncbi:MAG: hypothetical protein ABIN18_12750 [Pseudomonadota bacterium]